MVLRNISSAQGKSDTTIGMDPFEIDDGIYTKSLTKDGLVTHGIVSSRKHMDGQDTKYFIFC